MQTGSFEGVYYDGQTASGHQVRVEVSPVQLDIYNKDSNELIETWVKDKISIKAFHGSCHIENREKQLASLQIDQKNAQTMLQRHGYHKKPLHLALDGPQKIGLFAIVLAVMAGFYFSIDATSQFVANKVPMEWEQGFADKVMTNWTENKCEEEDVKPILDNLKKRLLRGYRAPKKYQFNIILTQSKMINAFALPGGTIVFTKGILKEMQSPDEFAGILAHEMTHVIKRHITAGIVRSTMLTSMWQAAIGDYSGILIVDPTTALNLMNLKFSRDKEREADLGGMTLLKAAKISPQGWITFFERLSKKDMIGDSMNILSSHPAHKERITFAEKFMKRKIKTRPAMKDKYWQRIKDACFNEVIDLEGL